LNPGATGRIRIAVYGTIFSPRAALVTDLPIRHRMTISSGVW